jgi:hypothetical protein
MLFTMKADNISEMGREIMGRRERNFKTASFTCTCSCLVGDSIDTVCGHSGES